jgi:hypothetical protein
LRAAADLVKETAEEAEEYLDEEAAKFMNAYLHRSDPVQASLRRLQPQSHREPLLGVPKLPNDGRLDWQSQASLHFRTDFEPLQRLIWHLKSNHMLCTDHVDGLNKAMKEYGRSRRGELVLGDSGSKKQKALRHALSGSLPLASGVFATLASAGVSTSGSHSLGAAAGVSAGVGGFTVLGTLVFSLIANGVNDRINIEFVRNSTHDDNLAEKVKRLRSLLLQGRLKKMTAAFREVWSKMQNPPGADDPVAHLQHLYAVQDLYVILFATSSIFQYLFQTAEKKTKEMLDKHNKAQRAFEKYARRQVVGRHVCTGTCYVARDSGGEPVRPLR